MSKKNPVGKPSIWGKDIKTRTTKITIPDSMTDDQFDAFKEESLYPLLKDYMAYLDEVKGKKDEIWEKKFKVSYERMESESRTEKYEEELDKLKEKDKETNHSDSGIKAHHDSMPLIIEEKLKPLEHKIDEMSEKMKEPEEIIPVEMTPEDMIREGEKLKYKKFFEKYPNIKDIQNDETLNDFKKKILREEYWKNKSKAWEDDWENE